MTMTKPTRNRSWMQWSLRSILMLMLLVSTFFAGRMSLRREVERLQHENAVINEQAAKERARAEKAAAQAALAQQNANIALLRARQAQFRASVEEGMKADALERSQY